MESLSSSRSGDEKEWVMTEKVSVQFSFFCMYRIKAIMNCNAIMNGSWVPGL